MQDDRESQNVHGVTARRGSIRTLDEQNTMAEEEGTKLWPALFPEWKGISLGKNEDEERGHGLSIVTQDYTAFEFHPDIKTYPNLARIQLKITVVSEPEDAPESSRRNIGKFARVERYLLVDRTRKVMQCIGANAIDDDHEDATKDSFGYNSNENDEPWAKPAGVWTWHKNRSSSDLQYVVNHDNTVMREVNYAHPKVKETGDWSHNCKFNLSRPPGSSKVKHDGVEYCIAPDISPPRHDLTDERLREITEYFTAEEGMYRSPTDKSNPDVEIVARFKKISQVDTPEERFGATLRLTFTWLVTKEDVVGYVAMTDHSNWTPGYIPPEFEITNVATGDGAADMTMKYSNIQLVKKLTGYMAMKTLTVEGDFWEPFELEHYPFDIQPLGVHFETVEARHNNINFSITTDELPTIRDTEWAGICSEATTSFAVDHEMRKYGRYTISIEACAERYFAVHVYRVVPVMALFSLASVVAFAADPDVHTFDRIGVTLTLMLTATTYSLVIADGLPTLGYLTFLDKYILGTFAFIALVSSEIIVIEWVNNHHSGNTTDQLYDTEAALERASYGNLALWIVMHIAIYIYITYYVMPIEHAKAGNYHKPQDVHIYEQGFIPGGFEEPPLNELGALDMDELEGSDLRTSDDDDMSVPGDMYCAGAVLPARRRRTSTTFGDIHRHGGSSDEDGGSIDRHLSSDSHAENGGDAVNSLIIADRRSIGSGVAAYTNRQPDDDRVAPAADDDGGGDRRRSRRRSSLQAQAAAFAMGDLSEDDEEMLQQRYKSEGGGGGGSRRIRALSSKEDSADKSSEENYTAPKKGRRVQHALSLAPFLEMQDVARPPDRVESEDADEQEHVLEPAPAPGLSANSSGHPLLADTAVLRVLSSSALLSEGLSGEEAGVKKHQHEHQKGMVVNPAFDNESFL